MVLRSGTRTLLEELLPPPPCFLEVVILKGDEVVCFVSVLDVLKMKGLGAGGFGKEGL